MFSPSSPESDASASVAHSDARTHTQSPTRPLRNSLGSWKDALPCLFLHRWRPDSLTRPVKSEKRFEMEISSQFALALHMSSTDPRHRILRRAWVVSGPISIILPSFFPLTDYRPRSLSLSPSLPPLICVTRRLARMFSQCIWADRVGMGAAGGRGCGRS